MENETSNLFMLFIILNLMTILLSSSFKWCCRTQNNTEQLISHLTTRNQELKEPVPESIPDSILESASGPTIQNRYQNP